MADPIRVLIVDDHVIVRDGIAAVLGTQSDLEIAGLAGTGHEALRQVAALRPDVVLMDLQMPDLDGASATAEIKTTHPDVRVLVLTSLAGGHSNKQIAMTLHVSEATVKTHLLHIYTKLGVADRTAAVTTALERGIIRLG